MSVVIETTLGDITVDLYLEHRPVTCLNFLKLCKMKYYNFNLFHSIRSGFIAQTGDPTGTGFGGESVFGILGGPQKRFFSGEKMPKIRHTDTGLLSMVCTDDMMVGSQFFFTLAPDLDSLDGVHCVIGEVTEGHEVLRKLNDVICDETHRPYRDVRITHTVILEDPFNDPAGFRAPSRSPSPNAERMVGGRIAPDEEIDETKGKSVAEVHEMLEEKEAKARATILEIIGDLPDADIAPPENVLFVCKLNPVTTDEDLEIIFSRFGKIVSCEVIRDKKTGDSLQYAFIEFSDKKSCEDAYFKMDNVLIDDRRIHVDFSQSVSKMRWLGKGRGVQHIGEEDLRSSNQSHNDPPNEIRNNEKNYRNGKDYDSNREDNKDRKSYDDRRYRGKEKHYSKHERSKKSTHNRERSRSKSRRDKNQEEAKDNRNNSDKNTQYNVKVNERKHDSSKEESTRRKEDSKHLSNRNKYSESQNNEKSRHFSEKNNKKNYERRSHSNSSKEESSRRKEDSKQLSYRDKYSKSQNNEKSRHFPEKNNKKNYERRSHRSHRDIENNQRNLKYNTEERYHKHREKQKLNVGNVEPRTPSPVLDKKEKKLKSNEVKKSRESRKKRTPSTSSSDSDSSESSSSSSSQSTTSGEENMKKKVIKIRKRKYSSSSSSSSTSSSDSSSSSTTSSSSSSSSTSSDDNTNKIKRRKKNVTKKELYKPKKKA